jgi:hypothetical protein
MCFTLYAGTTNPLPRKAWDKDARGLSVNSVAERDANVVKRFNRREVQYIGSTYGCGCDFPHVTLTRGEWVGYLETRRHDAYFPASGRSCCNSYHVAPITADWCIRESKDAAAKIGPLF